MQNKSYTKSGPGRIHNSNPKKKEAYDPTFSEIIRIHITNKQKEKIDAQKDKIVNQLIDEILEEEQT